MRDIKFPLSKENYFDVYLEIESLKDMGELNLETDVISLEIKDLDLIPTTFLKFFNGFSGFRIDTYFPKEYYTKENLGMLKDWYKDLVEFTLFSPFCSFYTSFFKFIDYYNGNLTKEEVLNGDVDESVFNELSEYVRNYTKALLEKVAEVDLQDRNEKNNLSG